MLASAIVSVGDSDEMITTAANKFFSKPAGRADGDPVRPADLHRPPRGQPAQPRRTVLGQGPARHVGPRRRGTDIARAIAAVPVEEDDRLALIIKGACSRELQDLGLVFNSLNIKEVQSEVAEARRRQTAVEAKANADIVAADQERRAREAQLGAEQAINDKQRDLEQRRAQNAATVAEAEAQKQTALAIQREAELKATQIAQANADAARVRIQAEAAADAEAVKIRTLGAGPGRRHPRRQRGDPAGRRCVSGPEADRDCCRRSRPAIAQALAQAKLINISGGGRRARRGGRGDRPDHRRHPDPARHPAGQRPTAD